MEEAKGSIRRELAAKRRELTVSAAQDLSAAIRTNVKCLPAYPLSEDFCLYSSVNNEVLTDGIFEDAIAIRKRVYFPRVRFSDQSLEWIRVWNKDNLVPGLWRVPEPQGEPVGLRFGPSGAVIFVPGLGFDMEGNRLGRGRGYYDRFLSSSHHSAVIVGLAYEFQLLPRIPADKRDQRVDYVVTEKRIVSVRDNLRKEG